MDLIYITIKALIFIFIILIFWFDNPVYSVLSLVCSFLSISLFLLYFNVEFLAYMYILVYVGAVSIFFLFVIMLLDINPVAINTPLKSSTALYLIIICTYFFKWVSLSNLYQIRAFSYTFNIEHSLNYAQSDYLLFSDLYVEHFYLFFITSLILLLTMLGTIGVCLKKS